jgi:hypothetical protein
MNVDKRTVGTAAWRYFQDVVTAGRGGTNGRLPRGGVAVSAFPTDDSSQLPGWWAEEVQHASHVVYHYGTPVAWLDERDGVWVVPDVHYSPTTTGVQNRIRAAVVNMGGTYRTRVTEPRG